MALRIVPALGCHASVTADLRRLVKDRWQSECRPAPAKPADKQPKT